MRSVLSLGALAIGDVAADTPVAREAPRFVEHRDARNGNIAYAAVGGAAGQLKIPEREVRVHGGSVLAPGFFIGLDVRNFPARLADFRTRRRRVGEPLGELLASEAMLGVGLPVDVEGELHEGAKARFARAKLLLGMAAPRTEFTE